MLKEQLRQVKKEMLQYKYCETELTIGEAISCMGRGFEGKLFFTYVEHLPTLVPFVHVYYRKSSFILQMDCFLWYSERNIYSPVSYEITCLDDVLLTYKPLSLYTCYTYVPYNLPHRDEFTTALECFCPKNRTD